MKRPHSELDTDPAADQIAARGHAKRARDLSTQSRKEQCKDVVRAHSVDLLKILQSVRDGKISIDEGPPKSMTKLLRNMLLELDDARQPSQETEPDAKDEPQTQPARAPPPTPQEIPPPTESYVDRVRPLLPMTAWTPEDISTIYPPLPPILDPSQEEIALIHQGKVARKGQLSYETLELLGDAFIYHLSTEYIVQTFPMLTPGRCSQIRERLVRNETLAGYAQHYGLPERAQLPEEFKMGGRDGGSRASVGQRQKVHADLFEAYIGALIRSSPGGVESARTWLKPLWAMSIAHDIQQEYARRRRMRPLANKEEAKPADGPRQAGKTYTPEELAQLAPKVQLIHLIACKPISIQYKDAGGKPKKDKNSNLPLYTVGVWVDGWGRSECLGLGSGLSKKDAGSKAAETALLGKKALKFYIQKRAEYYAQRQEQEAREKEAAEEAAEEGAA